MGRVWGTIWEGSLCNTLGLITRGSTPPGLKGGRGERLWKPGGREAAGTSSDLLWRDAAAHSAASFLPPSLPPPPHLLPVPPIDQREGGPRCSPDTEQGGGGRVEGRIEGIHRKGAREFPQSSPLLFLQGTRIALIDVHSLPGTVLGL